MLASSEQEYEDRKAYFEHYGPLLMATVTELGPLLPLINQRAWLDPETRQLVIDFLAPDIDLWFGYPRLHATRQDPVLPHDPNHWMAYFLHTHPGFLNLDVPAGMELARLRARRASLLANRNQLEIDLANLQRMFEVLRMNVELVARALTQ